MIEDTKKNILSDKDGMAFINVICLIVLVIVTLMHIGLSYHSFTVDKQAYRDMNESTERIKSELIGISETQKALIKSVQRGNDINAAIYNSEPIKQ